MYALVDWIAKLVQILYCIKIDIFIICSIVDVIVDPFVHSSVDYSFSGGGGGGGFFRTQRTPLAMWPCILTYNSHITVKGVYQSTRT